MAPPSAQSRTLPQIPPPPVSRSIINSISASQRTSYIRKYLVTLSRRNYCLTCSPQPIAFPCSKTCPLLSPYEFVPLQLDPAWHNNVVRDDALLRAVATDIQRHGQKASRVQIMAWAAAAEQLRQSGLSELEKRFERGGMVMGMRGAVGMDLEWAFERKWRARGREEEEMVGPDEGTRADKVKRRRGDGDEGQERGRKRVKVEEKKDLVVRRSMRIAERIAKLHDTDVESVTTKKRGSDADEAVSGTKRVRRT